MRSDIRIVINTVLATSPVPSNPRSPHAPRVVLVQCTVLHSNVLQERDLRLGSDILVLFKVSQNTNVLQSYNERKLEVGREVCVWRPWSTIDLPAGAHPGLDLGGARVWMFTRYYPPPSPPASPA